LIRTQDWWISSADNEYTCQVYDLVGIDYHKLEENNFPIPSIGSTQMAQDKYGCLNLRLLNNRRIGDRKNPYGWCHWDGTIGTEMLRPNLSSQAVIAEPNVHREWHDIAKAFPWLSVECQLYASETEEKDARLVMHYRIEEGSVARLVDAEPWDVDQEVLRRTIRDDLSGGKGVPIGELKLILSMVC